MRWNESQNQIFIFVVLVELLSAFLTWWGRMPVELFVGFTPVGFMMLFAKSLAPWAAGLIDRKTESRQYIPDPGAIPMSGNVPSRFS